MVHQHGFWQRNCCRAVAKLGNAFPCDTSNVQQSVSGARKKKTRLKLYRTAGLQFAVGHLVSDDDYISKAML